MPAPSLCVISGVVYDENGVPAVGVTLFLTKVLLNGVLIGTAPIGTANIPGPSGDHPVQYIEAITSIAGGVVSFTVPQLSTVYLEGNVSGYNNGEVALSIPATATSTLEALTPATFPIDVTTFTFLSLVDTPDDFTGDALKVARVNAAETAVEFATPSAGYTDADADARIKLLQKWALNFTGNGDIYLPAYEAMTVDIGVAAIGTGTLAYTKSTTALPSTFNATTLPTALEAGAWLKVSVSGISGFKAVELKRTA